MPTVDLLLKHVQLLISKCVGGQQLAMIASRRTGVVVV